MKKMAAFCLLCLFLTGCGTQPEQLQHYYASIQTASMQAEVIVHLSGDDRTFTVSCAYDREDGATTTIVEPEELSGLSATVTGEDLALSYDGSVWAAGDGGTLSAANCLPVLLKAIGEGYVTEEGTDRIGGAEYLRLAAEWTFGGETCAVTLWAQPESYAPYAAELSRDGEVLLTVHIADFTCQCAQETDE